MLSVLAVSGPRLDFFAKALDSLMRRLELRGLESRQRIGLRRTCGGDKRDRQEQGGDFPKAMHVGVSSGRQAGWCDRYGSAFFFYFGWQRTQPRHRSRLYLHGRVSHRRYKAGRLVNSLPRSRVPFIAVQSHSKTHTFTNSETHTFELGPPTLGGQMCVSWNVVGMLQASSQRVRVA